MTRGEREVKIETRGGGMSFKESDKKTRAKTSPSPV